MERIAVAYNDDLARKPHLNDIERLGEEEVIATAEEIAQIVGATLVPVRDDVGGALQALRRFDVVVNLCEGVLGKPAFEPHFALGLEMLGIAHTGCDPIATGICIDKILTKRLLAAAGIRVPNGRDSAASPDARWIVKPSREDAGIGIDAASVVSGERALEERIAFVERTYRQPALVEAFIDGRELNQAIYLGRALPPGEIVFDDALAPHERVVGWKAKWAAGSNEDRATRNVTPAPLDGATAQRVAELCLRAANVLGIDMYARFDLRMAADGELYLLDVNPNPDIGAGSGFRRALDAAGVPFADFLHALIMAAGARRRR